MGIAIRTVVALVAALACTAAAFALTPFAFTLPGTGGALGLQLGRGLAVDCPVTQLVCHSREAQYSAAANTTFLVGRAQLFPAFGVYGKLGAAYARNDPAGLMGHAAAPFDAGHGLAYGAGVSWDFSPRVSATFEWGSYDLRLSSGPVRSTNLGLQIRY